MKMQDKLIKIIDEAYGGFTDDFKKRLSKQLLDNGVIIKENYCEWIEYDYKTIRSPHERDWNIPSMSDFKFCPYCGKKIKIIK